MRALIAPVGGHAPELAADAFVAAGAVVVGRVRLGSGASVWYGSVLRGDDEDIVVAAACNIQDGCVLHADPGQPAVLGERVSLGHGAIVHAARVDHDSLIGMRAVVLNGAHVEPWCVIAAGAVLTPGTHVPEGSLVAGVPGKVRRQVGDAERAMIRRTTDQYLRKAELHRDVAGD